MQKYTLYKKDNNWEIYEPSSENIIISSPEESDVKRIYRKLKHGTGFNGWTPSFFCKEMVLPDD